MFYKWEPAFFDVMYLAYKRRKTVEELTQRKITMTAALHANSAFYKTEKGPEVRDQMISEFNERVDEIVIKIYASESPDDVDAAEENDPFLLAVDLSKQIVETEEQKAEQYATGERRMKVWED